MNFSNLIKTTIIAGLLISTGSSIVAQPDVTPVAQKVVEKAAKTASKYSITCTLDFLKWYNTINNHPFITIGLTGATLVAGAYAWWKVANYYNWYATTASGILMGINFDLHTMTDKHKSKVEEHAKKLKVPKLNESIDEFYKTIKSRTTTGQATILKTPQGCVEEITALLFGKPGYIF